ncbi:MAG TPA: hypothetical protein VFK78_11835 [Gemmatimonadales bacterium]|nr:hypothetical protein [Gemmatimonadales bacterium]
MPKGSSKSTAAIQRLLEERRQYEAWIARLDNAADATPDGVRGRVRADYEARLKAVTEELKGHAEAARQLIAQRKEFRTELEEKEARAAERLSETELRHAVGEYDEAQWTQVHKDALAELVSVREELQAVEADIEKLEELDALVASPSLVKAPADPPAPAASERSRTRIGPPPRPQPKPEEKKPEKKADSVVDELAFLKSVTEDDRGGAPSPRRASGAQFQPAVPSDSSAVPEPARAPAAPRQPAVASQPAAPAEDVDADEPEAQKTLKCGECGTMNLPTEWYCEQCGAELAAL